MSFTARTEPLTPGDRQRAAGARPDPRRAGSVLVPAVALLAGAASIYSAFALIARSDIVAFILIIGGIIVAIAGAIELGFAISGRICASRAGLRHDDLFSRAMAHTLEIVADAAWEVPAIDEDAAAVLLRVGPASFIYINEPWIDEVIDDQERPGRFPSRVKIRSLGRLPPGIVSLEPGPADLRLRPEIQENEEEVGTLRALDRHESDALIVVPAAALPPSWVPLLMSVHGPAVGSLP